MTHPHSVKRPNFFELSKMDYFNQKGESRMKHLPLTQAGIKKYQAKKRWCHAVGTILAAKKIAAGATSFGFTNKKGAELAKDNNVASSSSSPTATSALVHSANDSMDVAVTTVTGDLHASKKILHAQASSGTRQSALADAAKNMQSVKYVR